MEVRIPLESIRFKGGDRVEMGVVFWRRVSRLGVSVSWPDLPPGKSVFERDATLVFADLRERTAREAIPSFTYAVDQERATPQGYAAAERSPDIGVTAKYGITSSVTVEGTVNPDFSQVESDAFQVTVNQRYPVFYTEKRPFFMEGSGIFSLAGPGGDCNMIAAVHTRRIVDPIGGRQVHRHARRRHLRRAVRVGRGPGPRRPRPACPTRTRARTSGSPWRGRSTRSRARVTSARS